MAQGGQRSGPTPLEVIMDQQAQNNQLIMQASQMITDQRKTAKQLEEMKRQANMEQAALMWENLRKNIPGGSYRVFSREYEPLARYLFGTMGIGGPDQDRLVKAMQNSSMSVEQRFAYAMSQRIAGGDMDLSAAPEVFERYLLEDAAQAQMRDAQGQVAGGSPGTTAVTQPVAAPAARQPGEPNMRPAVEESPPTQAPTQPATTYGSQPTVGFEAEAGQLESGSRQAQTTAYPPKRVPAQAFAIELAGRYVEPGEVQQILATAGGRPYTAGSDGFVKDAPSWTVDDRAGTITGSTNLTAADAAYTAMSRLGQKLDKNNPQDAEVLRYLAVDMMKRSGVAGGTLKDFAKGQMWDYQQFGLGQTAATLPLPKTLDEALAWADEGRRSVASADQAVGTMQAAAGRAGQAVAAGLESVARLSGQITSSLVPKPRELAQQNAAARGAATPNAADAIAGRAAAAVRPVLNDTLTRLSTDGTAARQAPAAICQWTWNYKRVERETGWTRAEWDGLTAQFQGYSLDDYLARFFPSAESTARMQAAAGVAAAQAGARAAELEWETKLLQARNAAKQLEITEATAPARIASEQAQAESAAQTAAYTLARANVEYTQALAGWDAKKELAVIEKEVAGLNRDQAIARLEALGFETEKARLAVEQARFDGLVEDARRRLVNAQAGLAEAQLKTTTEQQAWLDANGLSNLNALLSIPTVRDTYSQLMDVYNFYTEKPENFESLLRNPAARASFNATVDSLNELTSKTLLGRGGQSVFQRFELTREEYEATEWGAWLKFWRGPRWQTLMDGIAAKTLGSGGSAPTAPAASPGVVAAPTVPTLADELASEYAPR